MVNGVLGSSHASSSTKDAPSHAPSGAGRERRGGRGGEGLFFCGFGGRRRGT